MDQLVRNAFSIIALCATKAMAAGTVKPPVADGALLALTAIEDQCKMLREVLGEGDGLEPDGETT